MLKAPLTLSSLRKIFVLSLIPFPKKLFSLTPKVDEAPEDPTPAPSDISPVGFSSTVKDIILDSSELPSLISTLTVLK